MFANRSIALSGLCLAIVLSNLVPVFAKFLYAQGWTPAAVYLAVLIMMCALLGSHELISLEQRSWHWDMTRGDVIGIVAAAVIGGVIDPLLFFSGLATVRASDAILLTSLLPFFVVCFAVLLLGEKFTRQMFAGGLVIVAGVVLLLWDNIVTFSFSTGALLIIGASLCGALTTIIHKKYINYRRTDTVIFVRTVISTAAVSGWLALTEPQSFAAIATSHATWVFLGLAVGGFLLPYLFYFHSLRHLRAMDAGVMSAVGRSISVVLASWLLQETLGLAHLLSLGFVVAGTLIISMPLTHRRIVPERLPNVGPLRR
jgi:drug/metabolite transporter (DMT)-like permease